MTPVPYVTPHMDHASGIAVVGGKWRCTGCGRRLTVLGIAPVATRKLPPWFWPGEIVNRHRARRMLPL